MDQHLKELDEECAQYRELLDSLKEGSGARLMDRNIIAAKLAAMKVTQIYYSFYQDHAIVIVLTLIAL